MTRHIALRGSFRRIGVHTTQQKKRFSFYNLTKIRNLTNLPSGASIRLVVCSNAHVAKAINFANHFCDRASNACEFCNLCHEVVHRPLLLQQKWFNTVTSGPGLHRHGRCNKQVATGADVRVTSVNKASSSGSTFAESTFPWQFLAAEKVVLFIFSNLLELATVPIGGVE